MSAAHAATRLPLALGHKREANNRPITGDTRDTALTCSAIVRRERLDGGMMEGTDGFRTKAVKNSGVPLRPSSAAVVFQRVSSA